MIRFQYRHFLGWHFFNRHLHKRTSQVGKQQQQQNSNNNNNNSNNGKTKLCIIETVHLNFFLWTTFHRESET